MNKRCQSYPTVEEQSEFIYRILDSDELIEEIALLTSPQIRALIDLCEDEIKRRHMAYLALKRQAYQNG